MRRPPAACCSPRRPARRRRCSRDLTGRGLIAAEIGEVVPGPAGRISVQPPGRPGKGVRAAYLEPAGPRVALRPLGWAG